MSTTLATRYDPKEAERWYAFWETSGYSHAEPDDRPREKRYTIVIPPPNVTGALHMGHALNNTLQDILVRWRRMQGYNTLWVPGTDHAGIATQAVVEKRIREQEGLTRRDLGRDELVRRIWAWKDDYEQRILNQLRRLGCSCDWQRTRFTFDEGCSRAVRETFFKMFKDGLVYRGKRLVNWDTQLQTSVADDETYTEEVKGGFWTFKYPVTEERSGIRDQGSGQTGLSGVQQSTISNPQFIRFSTTRPETMLGDTAVAVHPNDERYKHLIGRTVIVPLVNREIPIIADGLLADPTLGTGAVKVTPAHDPNDYACWQRHQGKPDEIGIINILNPDGTINEAGGEYAGLDRYVARERVIVDMERLGLYEGREDRMIPLKFSDRSKTPIEPYLSDQWFVRMGDDAPVGNALRGVPPGESESGGIATAERHGGRSLQHDGLAEMAMAAVRDGRVKIHPSRYAKTYLDWLGEKRDWCISRQLWWGHRIPVWSCITRLGYIGYDPNRPTPQDENEKARRELERYMKDAGLSQSEYAIRFRNDHTIEICAGSERADLALQRLVEFLASNSLLEMVRPGQAPASAMMQVPDFPEATAAAADSRHLFLLAQDPDALDTWFSSQLWPHSTLGWPERTRELEYYYPTSVLVTSRDIITLWVARMVIAGLYNCGAVPFRDVYITPKILDGFGQTMSKSKGNGVDPLDIIDKYGADALRFGIAHMTTDLQDARLPVGYECPFCQTYIAQKIEHQRMKPKKTLSVETFCVEGQSADSDASTLNPSTPQRLIKPRIKCPSCKKDFQFSSPNFDPDPGEPVARVVSERFELGRNFANKLWNAARFVIMNLEGYEKGVRGQGSGVSQNESATDVAPLTTHHSPLTLAVEERWILSRLGQAATAVTDHLEGFGFSEAAKSLYEFAWNDFCDWYVEMAKLRLKDPATRPIAQRVLATVLDSLLRLLHPIMPFVTEHIWQALAEVAPERGIGPGQTATAPSVMIASWPAPPAGWRDVEVEQHMNRLQDLIRAIRNIRSKFNVDPRSRVQALVRCPSTVAGELLAARPFIEQLAAVERFDAGPRVTKPADSVSAVAAEWELYVPLTGLIDRAAEIERNRKQLDSVAGQLKSFQAKLANADFVAKAPTEVVALHHQRVTELLAQKASIEEILRELAG